MKKTTFTLAFLLFCGCIGVANTLLQNPQTGKPFTSGRIDDITLASNGTDVALILANNSTGKLYAVALQDNNPADAGPNTITQITGFTNKLTAALGVAVSVKDFEVNPISRAVYVLAEDGSQNTYVVVVKQNGAQITAFDLNNVSYCTIGFNSTGMSVNDLAWGGNTLYVSSGNWSLSSEVATVTLPFVHNGTTANKVISRFSGGAYSTQAPLEKMSFLTVNGEGRLMGVTTCAPGYSFKTSQLNSSGVVQVTEDFNLSGMNSIRTVGMFVDGKSYLFNLHLDFAVYPDGAIMRIGEKYIDGSQVPAGKYDNNSVKLREWGAGGMTRTPGLTDDDLIIYTGGYKMIAPYSGYQLLTLTSGNVLQLMAVGAPLGISKVSTERKLSVYPNPAADAVYVSVDKADKNARILVYSLDGKEVLSQSASSGQNRVDLSALTKGAYILSVSDGTEMIHKEKILVQ